MQKLQQAQVQAPLRGKQRAQQQLGAPLFREKTKALNATSSAPTKHRHGVEGHGARGEQHGDFLGQPGARVTPRARVDQQTILSLACLKEPLSLRPAPLGFRTIFFKLGGVFYGHNGIS